MTGESYSELSAMLGRVRTRWRAVTALRAWALAAVGASGVLAFALVAHRLSAPEGVALVLLWTVAAVGTLVCVGWALASVGRAPADVQVARFIEERCPELEDSLATAVGECTSDSDPMARAVVNDAVQRTQRLDGDRIISRQTLQRAAMLAGGATLALVVVAGLSAWPAGQAARVLGLYVFPHRLALDVAPGDVRIRAGDPLRVVVRISSGAVVVPVLRVGDAGEWRETRMETAPEGFAVAFDRVERDFRYVVHAAGTTSREYTVTVIRPPRVERIELRYDYPSAFGMPARAEEDGGDIYGPAGTRVRVTVHTDKPVTAAALNITGSGPIVLRMRGDALEGELTIVDDDSYRVALRDGDGLSNPGETEYFIRTLQDRPPDVRIVRPASDRQVTPVEEVSIEARADDDFGVASLDLVYAVGAGAEKVVPFDRGGSGTAVTGSRTVYLEDLAVRPGDFVTYYARARDVSRGKRSSEARSDMFFLEVTPFEEEFVASQSQGTGGGSEDGALEELIQQQKDIITATWNLDRRGRATGARSPDDIRTVARGQRDLRTRAVRTLTQMQRASDLRRRRQTGGGRGAPPADAMMEAVGRAVEAMGKAQQQLDAVRTAEALPYEMTALNELLRTQAEIRRREVQQEQANGTGGRGANRRQEDLSSLFDRDLARQQQTNYETPASRETREEQTTDAALDKIRDLAARQDALNRSQQELARHRESIPAEELHRQLERLTREQSELRRQAEELARQLQQGQGQEQGRAQQGQGQQGQGQQGQGQEGRQQGQGQQGRGQQAQGQQGQQADGSRQQASRDLQRVSEDMQGAASELRRENPEQASARGSRAAERLRDLEQRMRGAQPDDRHRALGELQLESRQLAEAQRHLTDDSAAPPGGGDRTERSRRRAAEQERLADRTERLEQGVRRLAGTAQGADQHERTALNDAVRELDRQRSSQRMRNAARAERQSTGDQRVPPAGDGGDKTGDAGQPQPRSADRREGEAIARALENLAGRLGAAGGQSEETQRLTEELSRLRQLREQLAGLDRQLSELREGGVDQNGSRNGRQNGREGQPGSSNGVRNGSSQAPWQEARDLLDQVRRDDRLEANVPDAEGFNPGRSAPGTEPWKQDFAKWDELKVQVAAALERAEETAASRLRNQQATDRLNAGATQAVPEQYRRLVEKYYRALASQSSDRK